MPRRGSGQIDLGTKDIILQLESMGRLKAVHTNATRLSRSLRLTTHWKSSNRIAGVVGTMLLVELEDLELSPLSPSTS